MEDDKYFASDDTAEDWAIKHKEECDALEQKYNEEFKDRPKNE